MMILFYAWTDTQIINLINVKLNVYFREQADLIVYRLSRVSEELLTDIQKSSIFRNVYILEVPDCYQEKCHEGFVENLKAIFLGRRYWRYFEDKLLQFIGEKKYSLFLTGAFWSETLLIVRYLRKCNMDFEIMFYEEGLAAYNGVSKWLFRAVPSRGIKAIVRTFLYYGVSAYTYRKYVKGIFLYKPELSNIDYIDKRVIPLKRENGKFYLGESSHCVEKDSIYRQCKVIYIVEAFWGKSKYSPKNINEILDAIYSIKSNIKMIIKMHPLAETLGMVIDLKRYPELYVDNRAERIETILSGIDINNKIVITGNSTSSLYIKWVYGQTPYMILVDSKRDRYVEEYARRYVECYDTGKSYAPSDMDELKRILKKILKC